MAINETISKGNKYRRLKDAANKVWQRISFWTAASDVEFENGNTLQSTLGTVTGITDSLTSNSSTVAASAAAVYSLNSKITSFSGSLSNLYNAFVAKGVTPSAKTLDACTTAVNTLYTTAYDSGNSKGYSTGYTAGQNAAIIMTAMSNNGAANTTKTIVAGTYKLQWMMKCYAAYTEENAVYVKVGDGTYYNWANDDQNLHFVSTTLTLPAGSCTLHISGSNNYGMFSGLAVLYKIA